MSDAFQALEDELRAALAARDLRALSLCDLRARALVADALAAPARELQLPALAKLRDLYAELIAEVSSHRDALGRAVREQRQRRRGVEAYRR